MVLHSIINFDSYQIDDESGGVYSLLSGKLLKPRWNGGHWQVVLYRGRKRYVRFVHDLVLETFVGPRPEGMKALHRDDDSNNNHVSNLYWGTMSDNAVDRVRNGRDFNTNKTECKRGHQLDGVNLATWSRPRHRVCLACNRANTLANWRGINDEGYRQRLADEKYQVILTTGVV